MPYSHPLHRNEAYEDFCLLRAEFEIERPHYRHLLRMCRSIRVAGCFALLIDADALLFSQSLQVSGRCFAHFLGLVSDGVPVVSRAVPFLDALACGDFDTARAISQSITAVWMPELEYREDFLFFQFLFECLFRARDEDRCRELLSEYEQVLQGNADGRLNVARALLERDAAAFGEALQQLTQQHRDYHARMRASGGLPEGQLLSEGKVFIEGLALVRVAESRGLACDDEYPLIPSLIRGDFSAAFAPEAWRSF
jgi:hypothetical protein